MRWPIFMFDKSKNYYMFYAHLCLPDKNCRFILKDSGKTNGKQDFYL